MKFKTVEQLLNDGWELTTFYCGSFTENHTRVSIHNDARQCVFYIEGDKSVDECKEMLKDRLVGVND